MYDLDSEIREIDEYWDRENQYIKDSGIYTPEEVEQILASHEEIRRNKKDEAREKYRRELYCRSVERELMNLDREMELEPDDLDVDYDLGAMDDDDDYEMLRAMREERDAYDDFIASMDMKWLKVVKRLPLFVMQQPLLDELLAE